MNQVLADLPPGIALAPGQITVQFATPQQALERLLAMAIGNDFARFEGAVVDQSKRAPSDE